MPNFSTILDLHKKALPSDPLHLFSHKKAIAFFKSLDEMDWIKYCFEKEKLIYFSIVFPLRYFPLFIFIIFLATFKKSLRKIKLISNNSLFKRGILVYICVDNEFRSKGIGSKLIMSYKKNSYKKIYFITKEKTYNLFYKKLGARKIKLFGKVFCQL